MLYVRLYCRVLVREGHTVGRGREGESESKTRRVFIRERERGQNCDTFQCVVCYINFDMFKCMYMYTHTPVACRQCTL